MVKNHLKRITVPNTWGIKRKKSVYIARPEPSGHLMKESMPLIVFFREMLGRVKTSKELKYVLNNKEILLNGKKQHSHKASIGLFDILSVPETDMHFRLVLNSKGILVPVEVDKKEASIVPMKLKNKTKIVGGKTQLNFTNGYVMVVEKDDFNTGDVVLYDVNTKKIKEQLKLEKGVLVVFTGGKHIGKTATIQDIKEDTFIFKQDDEEFESEIEAVKKNAFVIGKKTPAIKLAD